MPRFFFHLWEGQTEFHDEEGQNFGGIAEAVHHARRVAEELAQNKSASELKECLIVVTDATDAEVARIGLRKIDHRSPSESGLH
jgi:hypothetical protein